MYSESWPATYPFVNIIGETDSVNVPWWTGGSATSSISHDVNQSMVPFEFRTFSDQTQNQHIGSVSTAQHKSMDRGLSGNSPEHGAEVSRNSAVVPGPPFRCTVEGCGRSYAHLRDLRRHMNTAHERKVKFPCKILACVQKNTAFYRSDHLTQHMRLKHSRSGIRAKRSVAISETNPGNAQDQFSQLREEFKRLQDTVEKLKESVHSARSAELEMRKEA